MSDYVNIVIAKSGSFGNLFSSKQEYVVSWMPPVPAEHLDGKGVLTIHVPDKFNKITDRSYRMNSFSQVDLLIFDLMKLSALMRKHDSHMDGLIDIGLFQYQMSKKAKEIAEQIARGEQ